MINGRAARAAQRARRRASSTCGSFADGDDDRDRAVARARVPGRQGPGRRPHAPSTAIIAAGGFVSVEHRRGARRATRSRSPKDDAERGDGRGGLHRLRRLRRRLPERLGDAVRRAPRSPTSRCLPQGQPERMQRVAAMVAAMDAEGFGGCTNHGECEAVCPKEIPLDVIARMNRDFLKATPARRRGTAGRRRRGLSGPP